MRRFLLAALFISIIPGLAFGQTAFQLTPSSIPQYTSEWNLKITGFNLAGNVDTRVLFANETTTYEIEALGATSTQVIVPAPAALTADPGAWSVTVKAIDATGTRL